MDKTNSIITDYLEKDKVEFDEEWNLGERTEASFGAPKELCLDHKDEFTDVDFDSVLSTEIIITLYEVGEMSCLRTCSAEQIQEMLDNGAITCVYGPQVSNEDGLELADVAGLDLTGEDIKALVEIYEADHSTLSAARLSRIIEEQGNKVISYEDYKDIEDAYESNKEILKALGDEAEGSFEEGYNNALEFVMNKIKGKE